MAASFSDAAKADFRGNANSQYQCPTEIKTSGLSGGKQYCSIMLCAPHELVLLVTASNIDSSISEISPVITFSLKKRIWNQVSAKNMSSTPLNVMFDGN